MTQAAEIAQSGIHMPGLHLKLGEPDLFPYILFAGRAILTKTEFFPGFSAVFRRQNRGGRNAGTGLLLNLRSICHLGPEFRSALIAERPYLTRFKYRIARVEPRPFLRRNTFLAEGTFRFSSGSVLHVHCGENLHRKIMFRAESDKRECPHEDKGQPEFQSAGCTGRRIPALPAAQQGNHAFPERGLRRLCAERQKFLLAFSVFSFRHGMVLQYPLSAIPAESLARWLILFAAAAKSLDERGALDAKSRGGPAPHTP